MHSAARRSALFNFSIRLGRRRTMVSINNAPLRICVVLIVGLASFSSGPVAAALRIEGQVQAGGGPLANSTVTLWAASANDPRQLAQTATSNDGRFQIDSQETIGADVILYLIAKGGEAAVNKGNGESSVKATAPSRANRSWGHFTSPSTSRIESGSRTPAIK